MASPVSFFWGDILWFKLLYGMVLQQCRVCKQEFPAEKFPVAGTINGKLYRRRKCQACYWKVKKARRIRLSQWLEDYKKTQSCKLCGDSDFRVLEFHHRDDNKEFNVSEMARGYAIERIKGEIAKCDCICVRCHRILHYEEWKSKIYVSSINNTQAVREHHNW